MGGSKLHIGGGEVISMMFCFIMNFSDAYCMQVQASMGCVLEPLEKFRKEQIGEAKVTIVTADISLLMFKFLADIICHCSVT